MSFVSDRSQSYCDATDHWSEYERNLWNRFFRRLLMLSNLTTSIKEIYAAWISRDADKDLG